MSGKRRTRADLANASREDVEAARRVVSRAIRRLNVLEVVITSAAVIIALVGGWLGALLARGLVGLPLRPTWMVLSVVLFVIPAALALTMDRRRRRAARGDGDAPVRDNPNEGGDG